MSFLIMLFLSFSFANQELPKYLSMLPSEFQLDQCVIERANDVCEFGDCKNKIQLEVLNRNPLRGNLEYYYFQSDLDKRVKIKNTKLQIFKHTKEFDLQGIKELEYLELHTDLSGNPIYLQIRRYQTNPFRIYKNIECGRKLFKESI